MFIKGSISAGAERKIQATALSLENNSTMPNREQKNPLESAPLISYWRSIALPVAVVLVSVEVQRHWGSNSGWAYLCASLLLDITWIGTLLGYAWAQRSAGAVIDITLFFLLSSGVLLTRLSTGNAGPEILKSILFWAPAICGWWVLSYHNQFHRVAIYAILLYAGLYFLDYPDSDRHYYEYALIGVMIIGLGRLIAVGMVKKFKQEIERLRAQTADELMRDPVTGVASKIYFEAELSHMSAVANRYRFPFSLAACSIDGFDHYASKHGEAAANDLLKTVSWRIAERIRTADTVCHLQNNEFAILLPNTTEHDAAIVAENIRNAVGNIPNAGNEAIKLHVAVSEHQFGEDTMATFDTAYRRLEQSRQDAHDDRNGPLPVAQR